MISTFLAASIAPIVVEHDTRALSARL